jgi:hypothetical protein
VSKSVPYIWLRLTFAELDFHGFKHIAAVLQQQAGDLRQTGNVGFVGVFVACAVEAGHEVFDGLQALDGAGVEVGKGGVGVDEEDGIDK